MLIIKCMNRLLRSLYGICKKYRLGSGFMAETVVFQYIIEAEKSQL